MSDHAAAPCEACPLGVSRAVASRGPVPARVLLLSAAPRLHEERDGVAFASPAFAWLEGMLAATGIDAATVHYATVIGCRPPHQRPARSAEIAACAPRLARAIDAIAPDVIVLCGPDVTATMLPGISPRNAQGQLIVRDGHRYFPIRHPYATLHHAPYVAQLEDNLRRLAAILAQELEPVERISAARPATLDAATAVVPLGDASPVATGPACDSDRPATDAGAGQVADTGAPAIGAQEPDAAEPTPPLAAADSVDRTAEAVPADRREPEARDDEAPDLPAQLSLF